VYSNYVDESFTLSGSNLTGITLFSYFESRVQYNNNNDNNNSEFIQRVFIRNLKRAKVC